MGKYRDFQVKKEVTVQNLITIETLDVSPGFSYPKEEHEFYELAYVYAGKLLCATNTGTATLKALPTLQRFLKNSRI